MAHTITIARQNWPCSIIMSFFKCSGLSELSTWLDVLTNHKAVDMGHVPMASCKITWFFFQICGDILEGAQTGTCLDAKYESHYIFSNSL